jgi:aspartyl-tRNA(Asn)/glutamyl-tRNA(Gln) amidotransferase subunit C
MSFSKQYFNKILFTINFMPKEKISLETVRHVAKLSRLELSEKELKKFQKDLDDILLAFKGLDKARPRCQASFQPLPIKDITRGDEVEKCLSQEEALANTKHKERGFFKGPRAV